MIPTRAAEFINAPPPPLWLDPNILGASKLVGVPKDRVQIIEEGEEGLLRFLGTLDVNQIGQWDAYVIFRPHQKQPYVYSRHQFWLAANLFLALQETGGGLPLMPQEGPRPWLRQLMRVPVPIIQRLGAGLVHVSLSRRDLLRQYLGQCFDLREYAISGLITSVETPSRPSISVQSPGVLLTTYVPDTSAFGEVKLDFAEPTSVGAARAAVPQFRREVRGGRSLRGDGRRPTRKPASGAPTSPAGKPEKAVVTMPLEYESKPTSPATHSEPLRRFPHMDLSASKPIHPGDAFQATVYLDESAPRVDEDTLPVVIEAPPEITEFTLKVWLVASAHFEVKGTDHGVITLRRDAPRSDSLHFAVTARPDQAGAGTPKLTAIFQHNGRPCGSVSITPPLAIAVLKSPPPPIAPTVEVHVAALPADLTVTIANPSGDGRIYSCMVTTLLLPEYKDGVAKTWELPQAASQIVTNHFKLFTTAGLSPDQRIANLNGAGQELFKVAPAHFREAFWQLVDQGLPLRTISIVSAEAYIPWELMVPNRVRPGPIRDVRASLGVEFAVGRWICEDFILPAQKIPLLDSWVFAPRYRPNQRPTPLAKAADEAALVLAAFAGGEVSPAAFDGLEAAMKIGGRSLIHFVCHGSSVGGSQAIICEDATELSSTALGGAIALGKACAARRPLVFLNACEVGRTTPALVGTGGFGPAFIQVGASGVLAPLWSVKDTIAHEVASEFYQAISADAKKSFASVLQTIREKAYAAGGTGEDTYAAYCFYGDPHAAIA